MTASYPYDDWKAAYDQKGVLHTEYLWRCDRTLLDQQDPVCKQWPGHDTTCGWVIVINNPPNPPTQETN
jgi:hypothetical protein